MPYLINFCNLGSNFNPIRQQMKNTIVSRLSIIFLLLCCGSFSFLQGENKTVQADQRSQLQEIYESECRNRSDIHEHLPVLRQLANECSSVVEIGVRSPSSQPGGLSLASLKIPIRIKPMWELIWNTRPPIDCS